MAISVPVAWQVIGYFLFISVLCAIIFLALASYSRVETVTGLIVPDRGIVTIVAPRNGIVMSIAVRDGHDIRAGTELAAIRAEEDGADAVSVAGRMEAAVGHQDSSLAAQMAAARQAADAQLRQLAAQRFGLSQEVAQLQSQISLQRNLIVSAQRDHERTRMIAEHGFISQRDLQVREETLLVRQQGLSQLVQSLASKRASLSEVERSAAQVEAQAQSQHASLAASRAEVARQAASIAGSRAYTLRAPVAGRVTALTARVGQLASASAPLMTIVPSDSVLDAQLAVPSAAIGFIKPGQEVRLAIDAFPYQRFGTLKGKVQRVASSAVGTQTPGGATISVYPVTVALERAGVLAYGKREALVPGMTLTARIVTEKQSFLQWLFEPLFAVQRR
ncbi:membrane fusion protein [Sphingomonas leidyi]|uniref:Membrane fusion protein n=1 Tax=Sphingomonas leidyi TaxID=68569 RepID=A0A7X5V2Y1_9SPHN|nr:membrane fusion protein [Sphingomonas leidyi]